MRFLKKGLVLLVLASLLLSACGNTANTASTAASSAASGSASATASTKPAAPKSDTIRVAIDTYPSTFLPFKARSVAEQEQMGLIFDRLFRYGEDFKMVNHLVKEYTLKEDNLTYVLTLQDSVYFHNGDKLTASDVLFTIGLIRDPKNESPSANDFQYIDKIEKLSDYQVQIVLKQPYVRFLSSLAICILPEKAYTADPVKFATNPIGSGPYSFVETKKGESITLLANDKYWKKDEVPSIKNAQFKVISEATVRVMSIINNEVDLVMSGILAADVKKLQENKDLKIGISTSTSYEYVGFMLDKDPVKDVKVRQAIAYALDKDAISKHFEGYRTYVTLAPDHWAVPKTLEVNKFDKNIEKAKQLLTEAGVKSGTKIPLSCTTGRLELAQIVKEQLSAIGLDIEIRSMEQTQFTADMNAQNMVMFLHGWTGQTDPDQYTIFVSTEKPTAGANRNGYNNAEVDKLYQLGRTQMKLEDRIATYHQAWKIMINDDTAFVPIYTPRVINAFRSNIDGLKVAPYPVNTLTSLAKAKFAS